MILKRVYLMGLDYCHRSVGIGWGASVAEESELRGRAV